MNDDLSILIKAILDEKGIKQDIEKDIVNKFKDTKWANLQN